ncbi:COP1-interacting protein 4 [Melia azedarach]|uniref:COP1-interacting protein 4 n=1 Tax=Melia azedarach TaxID=155640 RepID=A0ACC1XIC7_MELAZ|nr:COP1-interacting protein 4 [Melia azedarach]
MENTSSALDSGGTTPCNAVFIDTSLDTHLALIVSESDTVSDLKKKIMHEHPLCFPNVGGINIHALKVKRKGYFYHLSDSMFVKSAFDGISKSWFLSVDASSLEEQTGNQRPDGVNLLPYGPARKRSNSDDSFLPLVLRDQNAKQKPAADHNADGNCSISSIETNNNSVPELQEKNDLCCKEYEDPLRDTKFKEDSSRIMTSDVQVDLSLEGSSKNASVVKRRLRTKNRREDEVHDCALKEDNALAHVSDKDSSQQDNLVPDKTLLSEGRGRVVTLSMEIDEPHRISSSDANRRPGSEIQMIDILNEGTAVPGKHTDIDVTYDFQNVLVKDQCNALLEEASPGPVVKKKQKTGGNDDNGNSSKDSRVLICDSTKKTSEPGILTSQCSLGDKQKDTNATLDHVSTELLKENHLLITSSNSGKRKRKKKSSRSTSQVVAPSAKDDRGESCLDTVGVKSLEGEPDAAVLPRQSVQSAMASEPISVKENCCALVQEAGENNKVGHSFVERVGVSEDLHTIAAEGNSPLAVQEANNLNSDMGVSRNENVIVNDDQKFGSHQTAEVAEERELSQNNDANAMPSRCTTSNWDEINVNSKVDVISDLFDAKANVTPLKSSKKRKKSKKTRDPVTSAAEHTTCSVVDISYEPAHKDISSDKSRIEESIFSTVVGKEVSKTIADTSNLATDRETNNVIQNVLESLQDISKNSWKAENRDEKSRKKTKRKRNSASKSLPNMQTEDDDGSCKNATPSVTDVMEVEVDASSKLTKKTKLVKTSSNHQLNRSNREPENSIAGIEANPEGNGEGMAIQILHGNLPKSGSSDGAYNCAEVSCESDRTIVNDNFVPSQHKPDIVVSDEMLVDKFHENQGNGGKTEGFASSTAEKQRSLSMGDADSLKLQAKTNLPKVSGIGKRAPPSNKSDKLNEKPEEATRDNAVSASGMHIHSNKNKKTIAASSSSLESSKMSLPKSKRGNRHQSNMEVRKVSNNNANGEVVDGLKSKKSLLATSGAIFKDDSDGSSDEDSVDDSENSTRTPSDDSLSSDYSDGGSTAQQNGSYRSERKESVRRNINKSQSHVKLNTILRSSSRYKAAKLTASQLQDTESQPDEFVPDSQANL